MLTPSILFMSDVSTDEQEGLSHDILSPPFRSAKARRQRNIDGAPPSTATLLFRRTTNRGEWQGLRRGRSPRSHRFDSNRHGPSAGWTMKFRPAPNICCENAFTSQVSSQSKILSYASAADEMEAELKMRDLSLIWGGIFGNDVWECSDFHYREDDRIFGLYYKPTDLVKRTEMFEYLAVLIALYITGLSKSNYIEFLKRDGPIVPCSEQIRWISESLFVPLGLQRSEYCHRTWMFQHELTPNLVLFEAAALEVAKKLYINGICLFLPLDDNFLVFILPKTVWRRSAQDKLTRKSVSLMPLLMICER